MVITMVLVILMLAAMLLVDMVCVCCMSVRMFCACVLAHADGRTNRTQRQTETKPRKHTRPRNRSSLMFFLGGLVLWGFCFSHCSSIPMTCGGLLSQGVPARCQSKEAHCSKPAPTREHSFETKG